MPPHMSITSEVFIGIMIALSNCLILQVLEAPYRSEERYVWEEF